MLYSLFGLFLKRETLHSINRFVLLFVLIAGMILPLIQINTTEANIVTQGREMIESQITSVSHSAQRLSVEHPDGLPTSHQSAAAHAPSPLGEAEGGFNSQFSMVNDQWSMVNDWSGEMFILGAIAIYLLGLIICWLRYFWQMAALVLLIRRSSRIRIDGVPQHVHVVTNPDVKAPCSWMQWIILNTSDTQIRAIIKHELAHVRHGHSWDILLCELTCRMLWFVPFAWMLRQDLRDIHEYQADRSVLQDGIRDEEYQLLLIKKATSTGLQPVVNAFNQSPIKRRFKMMYRKPSPRWVALKAAYLLPLSALAIVAFARPKALSEIEEKVEQEVNKYVGTATWDSGEPDAAEQAKPAILPITATARDTAQVFTDANLVKADLAESAPVPGGSPSATPTALLDSTMQAVGARKIAEGTYIGHFQPNLNSDTVRIARATILNRESKQTGEHIFAHNVSDPNAFNITLNAETRKDRSGYYIRYLRPVKSTVRNYDKKYIDPKMLSTDSVLTGHGKWDRLTFKPVAMERNKKETRIYIYSGFRKDTDVEEWKKNKRNNYADVTIVDERTGDKYVCRDTDYDYFKYVRDEYIGKDTIKLYQTCLIFPPFSKHMTDAHVGSLEHDSKYSESFDVNSIPRKGRVITK